jgi:hypothetical protein
MFNRLWFRAMHCRRLFTMRFTKHPMLLLPIISILAGAGTLIFAHQRTGSIDGYAFSSLDGREYYQLALNLAHHATFSQSETPPFDPDTWRTPGYPLFLAIHVLIFGDSPTGVMVVQQLLNLFNTLLLAFIAQKYMSTRRALLVGLLFVFEPYHHFYSLWLMPTTLFVTVLLLIWHVWHRATASGGWQWSALLGALTGFAVLLRPISILLPVVVLVGLGIEWYRQREKRKVLLRAFGVTLAAMMLIVGAWIGRNKVVAGRFAISHQSGIVLSYFKATEVMLWRLGRTADRYAETSIDDAHTDQLHVVWEDIDARLRNHFADLPAVRRPALDRAGDTAARAAEHIGLLLRALLLDPDVSVEPRDLPARRALRARSTRGCGQGRGLSGVAPVGARSTLHGATAAGTTLLPARLHIGVAAGQYAATRPAFSRADDSVSVVRRTTAASQAPLKKKPPLISRSAGAL